jgi:membrane protease YdiL (CAAX protease family)
MKSLVQRYPLTTYFGIAYLISWGSGLVVLVPKLVRGEVIPTTVALFLFPVLVIGVALTGVVLTGIRDGRNGVRTLFARMGVWNVAVYWYLVALLTAPVLILAVLFLLHSFVSRDYSPNFFPLGLVFGIFPGFFEEIGWTGYAFPILRSRYAPLVAGIVLGVLWGFWHLPVVDSLGAASPHGTYWLAFFLAFVALVAAMRVLIVWVYSNTESLLLAQLMHMSSTAFLVILGPSHLLPQQEALWYGCYAGALWIAVALVAVKFGSTLIRRKTGDPSNP